MAEKKSKIPHNTERPVLITGHKNPDTDSICAAISYSRLKNKINNTDRYIPCRAGNPNAETSFVLEHFKVDAPLLLDNVKTQVSDIAYRKTPGVSKNMSLKQAYQMMRDGHVVTLPAVNQNGILEGLITMSDIAKSYMNVYDSAIISTAETPFKNILETLEATLITGDANRNCQDGKVLIAAANPEMMNYYIEPHDIVILGNRAESQLSALDNGADCIIICEGANASPTIKALAEQNGMIIMVTSYDAYTAARLINQSIPISFFMTKEGILSFEEEDTVDEIKDVMAKKRHRDFPVISKDGRYLGMLSRRNLLGASGKQVIMVDHNELGQALDGMENAEILEIIDHHRLGTIQTLGPVYFRNQPLGCTSTIVYLMYQENKVEIDPQTAGLMMSAIISDTLLFRSPTCTKTDEMAGRALAEIAGVDIEKYAMEMFSAASDLKQKTDREIFYQDFKTFTAGDIHFGVSQVSSLNEEELLSLKPRLFHFAKEALGEENLDMAFVMLTNILKQDTLLLAVGHRADTLIQNAFLLEPKKESFDFSGEEVEGYTAVLENVVSRKKQLIPPLSLYGEQM
ncbi:putative manganese-dependent inorganic diphosphatase [Oribacterium sinus]|uniref:inorganic diphosphatase n=1 Tax=Oribacterium sinus TaxID=237576 RepID=A0A930DQ68_9FIRM|nr:putative manganese-dependent inorganic diphosphatase [Oribacterium sinus]MBF1273534.1 putative manganese-dependent inorganic diphosphatase [Oribacterium sinus]